MINCVKTPLADDGVTGLKITKALQSLHELIQEVLVFVLRYCTCCILLVFIQATRSVGESVSAQIKSYTDHRFRSVIPFSPKFYDLILAECSYGETSHGKIFHGENSYGEKSGHGKI